MLRLEITDVKAYVLRRRDIIDLNMLIVDRVLYRKLNDQCYKSCNEMNIRYHSQVNHVGSDDLTMISLSLENVGVAPATVIACTVTACTRKGAVTMTTDTALKHRNRWLVVVAAIILNLALGALYSWPVFSNHLEKALAEPSRWKHFETQLVFSMATVFLALGVIAAGQLSERYQYRVLLLVSALFTGGGYILGGILPLRPLFVTVTIGVMAGFGIGVAYTLPISLAARWFPDHKGLVTGLAMAGFGLGSVIWSQIFNLFLDDRLGISLTFVVYGVVFAGMILFATRFFFNPPAGYRETVLARIASRADRAVASRVQVRIAKIAADSQGGGFILSEVVRQKQLMAAGHSAETARRATGLAALILFSPFNGS